jgi:hypothetical protein
MADTFPDRNSQNEKLSGRVVSPPYDMNIIEILAGGE